jgi:parallel beta-helix repeat protein
VNEHVEFQRSVAEHIAGLDVVPPSDAFHDELISRAGRSGQRPGWLALLKEPPMRNGSTLAVGSPTARIAAILAATILLLAALAGAGFVGSRLLAADGIIVVAQDGSGTFHTLNEAVEAAADGDTILVRPGEYVEAVVIDKDIVVKGDGDLADIVISAPEGGPTAPINPSVKETGEAVEMDPYAVLLQDSDAVLSDLTFRGQPSEIIISGGAPTIENVMFDGTGFPFTGASTSARGSSIVVNGSSTAVIKDNVLVGGGPIGIFDGAMPLVEGNVLSDGPHIWGIPDGAVIRNNTIEGALVRAIGVFDETSPRIEGNTIIDPGETGIDIWAGSASVRKNSIRGGKAGIYVQGANPTIEDNVISGSEVHAIMVIDAQPAIAGNELDDNGAAVVWRGTEGTIDGNDISGGGEGIRISFGNPTVTSNTVRGVAGEGIAITGTATPNLEGNTSCANGVNLSVAPEAREAIEADNEICLDQSA